MMLGWLREAAVRASRRNRSTRARAGTERRGNDLDGHPPVECNIMRGVDGGHAAATKLAEYLVLAQRGRAEELEFVGVGGVHGGGHPVGFLSGIHGW